MILLDEEDKHWLEKPHNLHHTRGHSYVRIRLKVSGKWRGYLLHRLIMDAPIGISVDHVNGNGLDNRRINLRLSTQSQNMANTGKHAHNKSGYKGVSWHKRSGKWCAQLTKNRKVYYLGTFDTVTEAAQAYDAGAREYHGEFAWLNFP